MSFFHQRKVDGKPAKNSDVAILCFVTLVVLVPVFFGRSFLRKWFPEPPPPPPPPLVLVGPVGWVQRATFAPDGKMVACMDGNQVTLWDTKMGNLLRTFPLRHTRGAYSSFSRALSPAFSPDGTLLALADTRNFQGAKGTEEVQEVKLWNLRTGALQRTLQGHPPRRILAERLPPVSQFAFSPDGKTLATVLSDDSDIKLWDVQTGALRRTWKRPVEKAHSIAFSPDGKTLAIGGEPDKLRLWDVKTGQLLKTFKSRFDSWLLVFTPDGKSLRNSGTMPENFLEGIVETWDVKTGRLRTTLRGFQYFVALAANGKVMAARSIPSPKHRRDGVSPTCLFDAETGKLVQTLSERSAGENIRGMSHDGTMVLSAVGPSPNSGMKEVCKLWRIK